MPRTRGEIQHDIVIVTHQREFIIKNSPPSGQIIAKIRELTDELKALNIELSQARQGII